MNSDNNLNIDQFITNLHVTHGIMMGDKLPHDFMWNFYDDLLQHLESSEVDRKSEGWKLKKVDNYALKRMVGLLYLIHSHWLRNKNLGDVRSVPFRSYARFWISSMCWNMLPWGISDETLLEHWDKLSPAIQTHSDDTDMIAELYQMVNDAPATIRGMRLEKGCTYAWKSVI